MAGKDEIVALLLLVPLEAVSSESVLRGTFVFFDRLLLSTHEPPLAAHKLIPPEACCSAITFGAK